MVFCAFTFPNLVFQVFGLKVTKFLKSVCIYNQCYYTLIHLDILTPMCFYDVTKWLWDVIVFNQEELTSLRQVEAIRNIAKLLTTLACCLTIITNNEETIILEQNCYWSLNCIVSASATELYNFYDVFGSWVSHKTSKYICIIQLQFRMITRTLQLHWDRW